MSGMAYRGQNGDVVELADDRQVRAAGAPAGEVGTADDGNPFGRMFVRYEDGRALESPDPRDDDLEKMLKLDGKARGIEQVLTLPLRWPALTVVPHPEDTGEAEFVREALFRPANAGGMTTPMELVQAQMTSAVLHRRAFFEKVFDLDEQGRVVYRKLAFRPARTCTLVRDQENRSFDGFMQKARQANGTTRDVPIKAEKAFVYIHGQHRDPLSGSSEMDTVWSCFEAKQKVRFLWFQFLERNVIPAGVLKTSGDKTARVREVAKLKSGGVVGLDTDEALDPFEAAGGAGESFKAAADWLSAEMSASVLASFTDLAQQGSGRGSYALSRDQSDLFLRSRQATLTEMASCLSSWAFADLVAYNFPGGKAPTASFADLAGHDSEAVRTLFESLIGKPPDPRVPQEFVDLLIELTAESVGMDLDRVRKAIEGRGDTTAAAGGPLVQGISAAAQLLQEAGVTGNGNATATVPAEPAQLSIDRQGHRHDARGRFARKITADFRDGVSVERRTEADYTHASKPQGAGKGSVKFHTSEQAARRAAGRYGEVVRTDLESQRAPAEQAGDVWRVRFDDGSTADVRVDARTPPHLAAQRLYPDKKVAGAKRVPEGEPHTADEPGGGGKPDAIPSQVMDLTPTEIAQLHRLGVGGQPISANERARAHRLVPTGLVGFNATTGLFFLTEQGAAALTTL